jgi:hypothetical protein
MTYDPYRVKTDALEAEIVLLKEQVIREQTTTHLMLRELKEINMHLTNMTGLRIESNEIEV